MCHQRRRSCAVTTLAMVPSRAEYCRCPRASITPVAARRDAQWRAVRSPSSRQFTCVVGLNQLALLAAVVEVELSHFSLFLSPVRAPTTAAADRSGPRPHRHPASRPPSAPTSPWPL